MSYREAVKLLAGPKGKPQKVGWRELDEDAWNQYWAKEKAEIERLGAEADAMSEKDTIPKMRAYRDVILRSGHARNKAIVRLIDHERSIGQLMDEVLEENKPELTEICVEAFRDAGQMTKKRAERFLRECRMFAAIDKNSLDEFMFDVDEQWERTLGPGGELTRKAVKVHFWHWSGLKYIDPNAQDHLGGM